MISDHSRDLLRRALAEPTGEDLLSQLSRASIIAHASRFPEFADIVDEASLPERAELDLHLGGASVRNHEADAEQFARLVSKIAKSVHATARSIRGRDRIKSHLRISALQPGSVRMVLRAPEPTKKTGGIAVDNDATTTEALAMRTIAAVLGQAEVNDDRLDDSLRSIDARARQALRSVAKEVSEEDWEIQGTLRKRGWPTEPVRLSHNVAQRILRATTERETETTVVPVYARVDSWSWSDLSVRLLAEHNRLIRATVTDPEVQAVAIGYLATPDRWVQGRIREITAIEGGEATKARVTRVLEALGESEEQGEMFSR